MVGAVFCFAMWISFLFVFNPLPDASIIVSLGFKIVHHFVINISAHLIICYPGQLKLAAIIFSPLIFHITISFSVRNLMEMSMEISFVYLKMMGQMESI